MSDNKYEETKKNLKRIRDKKNGKDPVRYFSIACSLLIAVLAIVCVAKLAGGGRIDTEATEPEQTLLAAEAKPETEAATETEVPETTLSLSEQLRIEDEREKENVIDSYSNLGIVDVSGYMNLRESPSKSSKIIGKLYGNSACEILDENAGDGWYEVSSGGMTGYISSEYILTGDEARERAYEVVKRMAVITADKLNVRVEPEQDAQVVEQVVQGERYNIISDEDGWIRINDGYISSDYVDVRYALNEARTLDMRTMVLNMYDHIGISNVQNYLNIRKEPKEDGDIIGKMTSKSAGEILETVEGGWYKIKSGPVTGYVKSDYILTGDAANSLALQEAKLMAIVSTDRLNVRVAPNTDSAIWTQISNSERYDVVSQSDGWIELQLDENTAFVNTDFVDVRYALNEAIKFTPVVEKPAPQPAAQSTKKKSGSSSGSSSSGGSSSGGSSGSSSGGSSSGGSSSGVSGSPGSAPASGTRSAIANYATQFLGNPYVWGGTSLTNGADCSGFTMSVMNHFGISLPHQSGSQAGCGTAVSAQDMRPGDLVFYSGSGGINHVALYIGNGQVCHASNARDGIKISTWNYRTPVAIRNVVGD